MSSFTKAPGRLGLGRGGRGGRGGRPRRLEGVEGEGHGEGGKVGMGRGEGLHREAEDGRRAKKETLGRKRKRMRGLRSTKTRQAGREGKREESHKNRRKINIHINR